MRFPVETALPEEGLPPQASAIRQGREMEELPACERERRDQHLPSGLAELPAPAGTGRADVMAPISALLSGEREHLKSSLDRLGSWLPRTAEKAANPYVEPRGLALSILPDLVMEDVASSTTQSEQGLP